MLHACELTLVRAFPMQRRERTFILKMPLCFLVQATSKNRNPRAPFSGLRAWSSELSFSLKSLQAGRATTATATHSVLPQPLDSRSHAWTQDQSAEPPFANGRTNPAVHNPTNVHSMSRCRLCVAAYIVQSGCCVLVQSRSLPLSPPSLSNRKGLFSTTEAAPKQASIMLSSTPSLGPGPRETSRTCGSGGFWAFGGSWCGWACVWVLARVQELL